FNRTAQWIAWQIVSEKDQDKRDNLIHLFLETGCLLLDNHNFHGAMQIATALVIPAVKRLIPESVTKDQNWKKFSPLTDPKDNYVLYRHLLSKFQTTPECLPIFAILSSDALHAYESFNAAYSHSPDNRNFLGMV